MLTFLAVAHQQLLRSLFKFNRTMARCLQKSLSQHLDPDLSRLYARSETTAKETLDSLKDLYQRLCTKSAISKNPTPPRYSHSSPCFAGGETLHLWPSIDTNVDRSQSQKQQSFYLPQRSASDPYPHSSANASVESLGFDLQCLRRTSSTLSLRSESSLVLQRNLTVLSRR